MLVNAFVLAVVTYLGMILIYFKIPRVAKKTILKGELFTDIGAAFITYAFLGGTATALVAAGIVGIMISVTLSWAKSVDPIPIDKKEK